MSEPHVCPVCSRTFSWGRDADSIIPERNGHPTCGENAWWKLTCHMQEEHPDHGHVCGRRGESPLSSSLTSKDYWSKRDGYDTCSYCGSLSPDEFFKAIEAGAEIGPTDKNYKVYVDLPHPLAGADCVVSTANSKPEHGDWIEVTPETRKTLPLDDYQRANLKDGNFVQVSKRGPSAHAKFYFQHLDEAGRDRFIALYNAKTMKIGVPGYFYVRPFFCAPVERKPG